MENSWRYLDNQRVCYYLAENTGENFTLEQDNYSGRERGRGKALCYKAIMNWTALHQYISQFSHIIKIFIFIWNSAILLQWSFML